MRNCNLSSLLCKSVRELQKETLRIGCLHHPINVRLCSSHECYLLRIREQCGYLLVGLCFWIANDWTSIVLLAD